MTRQRVEIIDKTVKRKITRNEGRRRRTLRLPPRDPFDIFLTENEVQVFIEDDNEPLTRSISHHRSGCVINGLRAMYEEHDLHEGHDISIKYLGKNQIHILFPSRVSISKEQLENNFLVTLERLPILHLATYAYFLEKGKAKRMEVINGVGISSTTYKDSITALNKNKLITKPKDRPKAPNSPTSLKRKRAASEEEREEMKKLVWKYESEKISALNKKEEDIRNCFYAIAKFWSTYRSPVNRRNLRGILNLSEPIDLRPFLRPLFNVTRADVKLIYKGKPGAHDPLKQEGRKAFYYPFLMHLDLVNKVDIDQDKRKAYDKYIEALYPDKVIVIK